MAINELHQRVTRLEVQMDNLEHTMDEAKTDRKEILSRLTSLEKSKWMIVGAIAIIQLLSKLPDLVQYLTHKP
jgi:hypothetical protein